MIAATNRIEGGVRCGERRDPVCGALTTPACARPPAGADLDEALVRRFEARVYVGLPAREERGAYIRAQLDGIAHALDAPDFESVLDRCAWRGARHNHHAMMTALLNAARTCGTAVTCSPSCARRPCEPRRRVRWVRRTAVRSQVPPPRGSRARPHFNPSVIAAQRRGEGLRARPADGRAQQLLCLRGGIGRRRRQRLERRNVARSWERPVSPANGARRFRPPSTD